MTKIHIKFIEFLETEVNPRVAQLQDSNDDKSQESQANYQWLFNLIEKALTDLRKIPFYGDKERDNESSLLADPDPSVHHFFLELKLVAGLSAYALGKIDKARLYLTDSQMRRAKEDRDAISYGISDCFKIIGSYEAFPEAFSIIIRSAPSGLDEMPSDSQRAISTAAIVPTPLESGNNNSSSKIAVPIESFAVSTITTASSEAKSGSEKTTSVIKPGNPSFFQSDSTRRDVSVEEAGKLRSELTSPR